MVARHDRHRPLCQPPALNVRNVTRSCYRTSNTHVFTPSDSQDTGEIEPAKDAGFGPPENCTNLLFPLLRSVQPLPSARRGKMTVGKSPLKSGRRKQPRIIAHFPVDSRFKADGGNLQILQGSPVICTRKESHADFVNPFPRRLPSVSFRGDRPKVVGRIRAHHVN
jgi:hypothetical protein